MKNYDVVSVCNALVDIIFEANDRDLEKYKFTKGNMHLVDRQVQEALIKDFSGREIAQELGGSAMNAIRTLATLGKKVCFAGMIAQDTFGSLIEKKIKNLKITGHLNTSVDENTGTCMVLVTPDGERTMVTYLGASRLYDSRHIPREVIKDSKYFHFCGYQWDTEGQKTAIMEAMKLAKDHGTMISFDVADPFAVSNHREDFLQVIRENADIVFANKEEAKLLYGLNPEETAKKITADGAIAVIKLGSEGAIICKDKQMVQVQPVKTQVVDTTAAGDMFASGFLYGLCDDRELDECGRIAATLASDVISRYGAVVSEKAIKAVL